MPPLMDNDIDALIEIYERYFQDIERNANERETSANTSYKGDTFKEYKLGYSKKIIDEIDDLIGPLYGLTKEEIEFIKNYEFEFRLSDDDMVKASGVDLSKVAPKSATTRRRTTRPTAAVSPHDEDDEVLEWLRAENERK